MKLRKIILIFALVFSITACGGDDEKGEIETKQEEASEPKEGKKESEKKEAEEKKAKEEKEVAEKKALNEAKAKATEELKGLEFLDAKEIVDFTGKINDKDNPEEVKNIINVAKKSNNDKKNAKENADKIGKLYQKASVESIIDGDTIEVKIGDDVYKLRLVGINTAEINHPDKGVEFFGKEAYEFTKQTLENKEVYLEKDVSEVDKYQRILRYVWLSLPKNPEKPSFEELRDQSLNGILVRDGYANAVTYPPDVKYSEWLAKIEKEAQANNMGLWNESAKTAWEEAKNSPYNRWVRTTAEVTNRGKTYTADTTQGPVKANVNSNKYHVQGQQGYNKISVNNVVWFNTKEEAEAAGYLPAKK